MLVEAIISFNRYILMIIYLTVYMSIIFNTYRYYHDGWYVLLTYSLVRRFLIANYTKKGPDVILDPGLKNIGKQVGLNWPI